MPEMAGHTLKHLITCSSLPSQMRHSDTVSLGELGTAINSMPGLGRYHSSTSGVTLVSRPAMASTGHHDTNTVITLALTPELPYRLCNEIYPFLSLVNERRKSP